MPETTTEPTFRFRYQGEEWDGDLDEALRHPILLKDHRQRHRYSEHRHGSHAVYGPDAACLACRREEGR